MPPNSLSQAEIKEDRLISESLASQIFKINAVIMEIKPTFSNLISKKLSVVYHFESKYLPENVTPSTQSFGYMKQLGW